MLSIPWHQRHWKQSRVQFRLELMDDLIFGTFRTFLLQCQSLSTKSELTSNFICLFYQFLHRINSIFACCRRQKTSIGKHAPNLFRIRENFLVQKLELLLVNTFKRKKSRVIIWKIKFYYGKVVTFFTIVTFFISCSKMQWRCYLCAKGTRARAPPFFREVQDSIIGIARGSWSSTQILK